MIGSAGLGLLPIGSSGVGLVPIWFCGRLQGWFWGAADWASTLISFYSTLHIKDLRLLGHTKAHFCGLTLEIT